MKLSVQKRNLTQLGFVIASTISLCFAQIFLTSQQLFAASERVVQLNNDGLNALKSGNYGLAAHKFLECLKIAPDFAQAKENLAKCFCSWGIALEDSPARAIEKFRKALFYYPKNLKAIENLDRTIRRLDKDPQCFADRVELGKKARLAGDLEGGIFEYSEALKLKEDAALRIALGDGYYARDQVDDAIAQYKIASSAPELSEELKARVFRSLGQAYHGKGEYQESRAAYDEARKMEREQNVANNAAWIELLKTESDAPKRPTVLNDYNYLAPASNDERRESLERDRHINYGIDLEKRKLYKEALSEFNFALKLDSELSPVHKLEGEIFFHLGAVYFELASYGESISFYQKSLAIAPSNNSAIYNLATAFYASQQFPEAQKLYEQLYKKEPKAYVDVLWLIATIMENNKQGNDALATYTKYVTEAPRGTYNAQAKERIDVLRKDPNSMTQHTQ